MTSALAISCVKTETETVSVQYLATDMLHQGTAIKKLSTNEPRNVQLSDTDCDH